MDSAMIAEIERNLIDEHKKDIEALARLKRFLPEKKTESRKAVEATREVVELEPPDGSITLIGRIEALVNSRVDMTWTTQTIIQALKTEGFQIRNQKPEQAVSLALSRLLKRGQIALVRRGAGSSPNIYKGKPDAPSSA